MLVAPEPSAKLCTEIAALVYRRMSEPQFWATYFLLVNDFLDKGGGSGAGTSACDNSPGLSADGGKSTAAPSALTAWEDVQPDEGASARSPNTAAEPGDDLDEYLQVCTCQATTLAAGENHARKVAVNHPANS